MGNKENAISVFEDKRIRRTWHNEDWWFSIVDVVGALTESEDPRKYWSVLKTRLKFEGSQLATNCSQLKLQAVDGKFYITDVGNTEYLFRLIQSVPSPKAEPFKLWLARIGYERIQEIKDPSLSIDRARRNWMEHGYSQNWIQQRMMGQETRNKLTDYWRNHEIKEREEFAILTNIIHKEWTGLNVSEHKALKSLQNQNLRDHMNEAELIFTALAELSTREVAESVKARGLPENKVAGKVGGGIAKSARIDLENKTKKKVITSENYLKQSNKLNHENKKQLSSKNVI